MESELQIGKGRKSLDDIKQICQFWNEKHCDPPLNNIEFERQWKQAIKFVSKSIKDNNHYNGNGHNNNNKADSKQEKKSNK
jgi:hypothetical protein